MQHRLRSDSMNVQAEMSSNWLHIFYRCEHNKSVNTLMSAACSLQWSSTPILKLESINLLSHQMNISRGFPSLILIFWWKLVCQLQEVVMISVGAVCIFKQITNSCTINCRDFLVYVRKHCSILLLVEKEVIRVLSWRKAYSWLWLIWIGYPLNGLCFFSLWV